MANEEHSKPGPKLNEDQRALVLRWIAAFPRSNRTVTAMCRMHGFPPITEQAISYYRTKYGDRIVDARREFIDTALNQGWADRKNRVAWLSGLMEDWIGREPISKEVAEMAMKIEKQISERVDDLKTQRVEVTFEDPSSMADLLGEAE